MSAPYDRVVLESLAVLATVADQQEHFAPVMQQLVERFRGPTGARLLQRRGATIVRQLCVHLGAGRVLMQCASILEHEHDLRFAAGMTQALNLVLLTAPELKNVRAELRAATKEGQEGEVALFVSLYRCWAHSAGALLSLLLLAQVLRDLVCWWCCGGVFLMIYTCSVYSRTQIHLSYTRYPPPYRTTPPPLTPSLKGVWSCM